MDVDVDVDVDEDVNLDTWVKVQVMTMAMTMIVESVVIDHTLVTANVVEEENPIHNDAVARVVVGNIVEIHSVELRSRCTLAVIPMEMVVVVAWADRNDCSGVVVGGATDGGVCTMGGGEDKMVVVTVEVMVMVMVVAENVNV